MFGPVEPIALVAFVVAIVATLATGYAYFRSSAVKVWEQNSEAYRARVDLLEKQNTDLLREIDWMKQRIHELEARPSYEQVVALVRGVESNIIGAVRDLHADTLAVSKGG